MRIKLFIDLVSGDDRGSRISALIILIVYINWVFGINKAFLIRVHTILNNCPFEIQEWVDNLNGFNVQVVVPSNYERRQVYYKKADPL